LEIRQGEFGNHVPGLTTVPVSSLSDVEQLMETADRNRWNWESRVINAPHLCLSSLSSSSPWMNHLFYQNWVHLCNNLSTS